MPEFEGLPQDDLISLGMGGVVAEEVKKRILRQGDDNLKKPVYFNLCGKRFSHKMPADDALMIDRDLYRRLKVGVVGAGALGNIASIQLAKIGFGRVDYYDFDIVESHNLTRQIHFYDCVGRQKAESLALKHRAMNPECDARGICEKFEFKNGVWSIDELNPEGYDVLFDLVDNMFTRAMLGAYAVLKGIPLISAASSPDASEWLVYAPGKTPCLEHLFAGYYERGLREEMIRRRSCTQDPNPAVIMTNQVAGAFAILEALTLFQPEKFGMPFSGSFKYSTTKESRLSTRSIRDVCDCHITKNVPSMEITPEMMRREDERRKMEEKIVNEDLKFPAVAKNTQMFQHNFANGLLGVDYGLIIVNNRRDGSIDVTTDGRTIETIEAGKGGYQGYLYKLYHDVFFDSHDGKERLLYTTGDSLYEAKSKNEHTKLKDFGGSVWGVTRHKEKIILCLHGADRIVSLDGSMIAEARSPMHIKVFNGNIYHTGGSGGGLVLSLEQRVIKGTEIWFNGLTVLGDKLYFGGGDKKVYSYDGETVQEFFGTGFPIWGLCGVQNDDGGVLYAGGFSKMGILSIPIKEPTKASTILGEAHQIEDACSITTAPLPFIKKLISGTDDATTTPVEEQDLLSLLAERDDAQEVTHPKNITPEKIIIPRAIPEKIVPRDTLEIIIPRDNDNNNDNNKINYNNIIANAMDKAMREYHKREAYKW